MARAIAEMRDLGDEELIERLESSKEELFNLRFQLATGQLDNPMRIKQVRHDVARILTVLREREIEASADETALATPRRTPRPAPKPAATPKPKRAPKDEEPATATPTPAATEAAAADDETEPEGVETAAAASVSDDELEAEAMAAAGEETAADETADTTKRRGLLRRKRGDA